MPERVLTMTALMTSDMANAAGHVHGGRLMHLLDNVAYACASRYSRRNVVTSSVSEVAFEAPLRVGDLVTVDAEIRSTGRTSMVVALSVHAEHIRGGERRATGRGSFRMVALDDAGRPTPVPPLATIATAVPTGTSIQEGRTP